MTSENILLLVGGIVLFWLSGSEDETDYKKEYYDLVQQWRAEGCGDEYD